MKGTRVGITYIRVDRNVSTRLVARFKGIEHGSEFVRTTRAKRTAHIRVGCMKLS